MIWIVLIVHLLVNKVANKTSNESRRSMQSKRNILFSSLCFYEIKWWDRYVYVSLSLVLFFHLLFFRVCYINIAGVNSRAIAQIQLFLLICVFLSLFLAFLLSISILHHYRSVFIVYVFFPYTCCDRDNVEESACFDKYSNLSSIKCF